jgi:peptide-methionine (S)-S-oxide reductase
MSEETAILAGGCYWGAQELIRRQAGVVSTRVGWSGGDTPDPTDDDHGDHAEAVEITYDTDLTSYRDLLEFFFQIHDPTTLNRQGDETGRYVRSAIFYRTEHQRLTALDTVADVDASGLWPGKVVTEVVPAGPFWEAQEEDQDYLQKHPDGETCHFVRPGWKLPRRPSQAADHAITSSPGRVC